MTEKSFSPVSVRNIILILSAAVVIIAVATAVFFYLQYYQTQQLLKNPSVAAQQQTDSLLAQVGRLIDLPTGEQPTIATVSDVTKLKGQPFFQNAQNGDKVLIYAKARKAILFRPSEDKIIDVAPVNIGPTKTNPIPTGAASVTPKLTRKPTPTATPAQ